MFEILIDFLIFTHFLNNFSNYKKKKRIENKIKAINFKDFNVLAPGSMLENINLKKPCLLWNYLNKKHCFKKQLEKPIKNFQSILPGNSNSIE